MTTTPLKPGILRLLAIARRQELAFVERLSEQERNEVGTQERWSAKDMVANIAAWKQLQTGKLATAIRGETPPEWKDMALVNQMNADIFLKYREYSWQQVMQEAEQSYEALVAQVESLSEEELTDGQRYEWNGGEALYGETLGNGVWYPYTCITRYYQQGGENARAIGVYETLVEAIRQVAISDDMIGGAYYNLACICATSGQPEKAIVALSEALRLRPSLAEWAQQDSDLQSLHDNPAFKALFEAFTENSHSNNLIAPHELYEQVRGDAKPLVIDVRGPKEYEEGHVQGAINIPLGQLPKKLAKIAHDREVVTYCNMHHRGESRGERAAALLREHGYQVKTLDGGYPGWKEQGLPVEEHIHI